MGSTAPLIHIGYHKTATTFLQQELFADDRTFQAPWKPQSAEAIEHFVLTHPGASIPAPFGTAFWPLTMTTDASRLSRMRRCREIPSMGATILTGLRRGSPPAFPTRAS